MIEGSVTDVDVAESTPLIGMRLLEQNELTILAVVDGPVTIRSSDETGE